jgi:D-alanyl-D-alanine carboxypeptidase/D-alanyl-D-alanine-endopeptidase (penicillin-binding protein 4)
MSRWIEIKPGQTAGRLPALMAALLFAAAGLCPASAQSQAGITSLIGARDAVLVTDSQGAILAEKNATTPLVPASTLKVLTSLVAAHYLAMDHHFVTVVYRDPEGNLKIEGGGDPLLTSESLSDIARALAGGANPKLTHIKDLVVDSSYFAPGIEVPGKGRSTEPYDAPIGALCANFNTVAFRKSGGGYVSTEAQTPLLPSAMGAIRASGLKEGRITLSHRNDENARYAGELFLYFLKEQGVQVAGTVKIGRVDKGEDREIYRYVSPYDLSQVISQLLEYSNNFIANQLLVAAGAAAFGPPGTLSKGVRAAEAYCRDILHMEVKLVEGSGLSRQNRLTARQLDRLLQVFEPYRILMRHDGTEYYKTGSLHGIRTRVGYIAAPDGSWARFVVMCNTPGKTTDRILNKIKILVSKQ